MTEDYFKKYEPFFGKWYIEKEIGSGGFAKVYSIYWDDKLGHRVYSALKVMHIPSENALSHQKEMQPNSDAVKRFFERQVSRIKEEISILQSLRDHPNVVTYEDHDIVDVSNENTIGWDIMIRMELLHPISVYFQRSNATQYDLMRMWWDIANALVYCEKQGILHRDIKPANILMSDEGIFKLSDFGAARQSFERADASTRIGTDHYMAPEVDKREKYDRRADIYSLGSVIYYYLNYRRHPFQPPYPKEVDADDDDRAESRRLGGERIPMIPTASKAINAALSKSLAYRAIDRYKSAAELQESIRKIMQDDGLRKKLLNQIVGIDNPDVPPKTGIIWPWIMAAGTMFALAIAVLFIGLTRKKPESISVALIPSIGEGNILYADPKQIELHGVSSANQHIAVSVNDQTVIIDSDDGTWEYILPEEYLKLNDENVVIVSYQNNQNQRKEIWFSLYQPKLETKPTLLLISKVEQNAPTTGPKADAKSPTQIEVEARVGEEYSIDNGVTWSKPDEDGKVIFDGLTPGNVYEVMRRMAETDTQNASENSPVTSITMPKADQAPPMTGPTISIKTPTTITVNAGLNEEYSLDSGKTWSIPDDNGKVIFDGLTPGNTYEVISRMTEDDQHEPSLASQSTTVTLPKMEPDAMTTAPKAEPTSSTTISVVGNSDEEYSIDNGKTWQIPNNGYAIFSNLTPGKTYEVISRKVETDTQNASSNSPATSITMPKEKQDLPETGPIISDYTLTTITVDAEDAEEYSIDDGRTWIKSDKYGKTVFDGLMPGSVYEVVSRKAGDDQHEPSLSSVPTTVTLPKMESTEVTTAPKAEASSSTSISVVGNDDEEYSIDGGNTWVKPNEYGDVTFENLTPGSIYEVVGRKAETNTEKAGLNSSATIITIPKTAQDAPMTAPTISIITPTAITVNAEIGEEYSIDGGETWSKPDEHGKIIFEGLTSGNTYEVLCRKAGDDQHEPSLASVSTTVTLPKQESNAVTTAPKAEATSSTTISVVGSNDEEYSIDGGSTWVKPNEYGNVIFDKLSPGSTYKVVARKSETDTQKAGQNSSATSITMPKKEQAAPILAPTISSRTSTSITVDAWTGEEYSVDGGKTWAKSDGNGKVVFDGLTPGTTYAVVSRYVETSTLSASPNSPAMSITMLKEEQVAPNTPPKISGYTSTTITVVAKDGEEYSIDGGKMWIKADKNDKIVFDGLIPGETYEVISRKAETASLNASMSSPAMSVTTSKAEQDAPNSAPRVEATSTTAISVLGNVGEEYSIDDGKTWVKPNSDGNAIFDNLTPGKTYKVISRNIGDDQHEPSLASAPTVITLPEPTPTARPLLSEYGELSAPRDGSSVEAGQLGISGWLLVSDETSEMEFHVDIKSGGKVYISTQLKAKEMRANTFEQRQEKYEAIIAAKSGYEVKDRINTEDLPLGQYVLTITAKNLKTNQVFEFESCSIIVADANAEDAEANLAGILNETSSYYVFKQKGFAIGIDDPISDSFAPQQVIITGWINAPAETSVGVMLMIDGKTYDANTIGELGGALTVENVPRDLSLISTEIRGGQILSQDKAGIIITASLPFLHDGGHGIIPLLNVAVPGKENELVEFSEIQINISSKRGINTSLTDRIAKEWLPESIGNETNLN